MESATEAGNRVVGARVTEDERSVGALLTDLSDQLHRLVDAEVKLAVTEVRRKAKRAGRGAVLFGGAGLLAVTGVVLLVVCAVLALALVLPGWLAALIVGVGALLLGGLCALTGRFELRRATPPVPEWTMASVRDDIDTIKRGAHR
jgi:uncharacterized membrane protein YqjE